MIQPEGRREPAPQIHTLSPSLRAGLACRGHSLASLDPPGVTASGAAYKVRYISLILFLLLVIIVFILLLLPKLVSFVASLGRGAFEPTL